MNKRQVKQQRTDFIPERKTEEQYEDFFQEMLARMLPKVKRNNIRPSYLNDVGFASHTEEDVDYTTTTNGITADDTLIYFKVYFDPDYIEAFKQENGRLFQNRFLRLKVEIYGAKRTQIGLLLRGLIRADYIMDYLNSQGMYLYTEGNIDPDVKEFMHGQWYKRYDLEWTFNECMELDVPQLPKTALESDVTLVTDKPVKTISVRVEE